MSQELTDQELLYASEEDWAFFKKVTEGLPTREGFRGNFLDKDDVEIPYGSGPHILKYFREAIEITGAEYILEIGFNMGHGAAMLLELDMFVTSIDISEKWETKYAAMYLELYADEFVYQSRNEFEKSKSTMRYDLAFVDGAHDELSIINDVKLCMNRRIKYLLFDDWYPRYGETQKAVAKFPELELIKDMNNLRLYKINYDN